MARMNNDIARLAEILSWSLMDLIWGLAVMLGVSVVMLIVNWKLALLVLMVVPVLAWLSVVVSGSDSQELPQRAADKLADYQCVQRRHHRRQDDENAGHRRR